MSDYDLNALVDMGKEDVLQFMRQNLFSGVSRDRDGASIYSLFFLAVSKSHAELDILRTRTMIIQENEVFLSDIKSNDPHISQAMARAAGRVSQMKQCLAALDRIVNAQANPDEAMAQEALDLKLSLEEIERMSVRLGRCGEGQIELAPLCEVSIGSKACFL